MEPAKAAPLGTGPVDHEVMQNPTFKEKFKAAWPRIQEIATEIFKLMVGVVLFVMNPAIFATGLIIGVVWDKQSDETIDKIVNIVKKQPIPVLLALGVASVLCLQVTSGASSLLYGAYMGSRLVKTSKEENAV